MVVGWREEPAGSDDGNVPSWVEVLVMVPVFETSITSCNHQRNEGIIQSHH